MNKIRFLYCLCPKSCGERFFFLYVSFSIPQKDTSKAKKYSRHPPTHRKLHSSKCLCRSFNCTKSLKIQLNEVLRNYN